MAMTPAMVNNCVANTWKVPYYIMSAWNAGRFEGEFIFKSAERYLTPET